MAFIIIHLIIVRSTFYPSALFNGFELLLALGTLGANSFLRYISKLSNIPFFPLSYLQTAFSALSVDNFHCLCDT